MAWRGEKFVAQALVQAMLAALQRGDGVGVERDRQLGAAPMQHGDKPDALHHCIVGAGAGRFLTKIKSALRRRPIVPT